MTPQFAERLAIRRPLRVAASLTGYAISGMAIWFVLAHPGWAGRDVDVWLRVGNDVRAGVSPYYPVTAADTFYYAPPWALIFGALTWFGKPLTWLLIFGLELASLRYIAGSWLRVGYFGLVFLTGAELASGAMNLIVAAGLLAAARGDARLAAFMALAKLSPAFAIREWRGPALVLLGALIVTLPWLGWWGDWIRQLIWASGQSVGYSIPLPLRVVAGLGIVSLWRSRRAGILAAAIAIPGLYPISIVLLYPLFSEVPAQVHRGTTSSGTCGADPD